MDISKNVLYGVISKYAAEVNENYRRFENLESFLGLNSAKEETSQEKEAASRSKRDVQKLLREWFFDIVSKFVRAGYFSQKNRAQHEWRDEVFQNAGKTLYDKLRYALMGRLGQKIKSTLGTNVNIDELSLPEDIVYEKLYDLLSDLQSNPSFLNKIVNRWVGQEGGFKEVLPEATVEEAGKAIRKEYKPGMAEFWFRPLVTDDVYDNYSKYLEKNTDDKFKDLLDKVRKDTGRDKLIPEDVGIFKGKPDPKAFDILNQTKNFNLDIHDASSSYNPKEKADTWEITFSIPELSNKIPSIYGDILYRSKIPASVRYLDPTDKIPVSVQHSYETKSGKRGMSLRLDDVFKNWTEDTMDTLNNVGFVSKDRFDKFIDAMSSVFAQQWITGKNLDEMVSDLGGDVRFHGKSFASADDLTDLVDQISGRPSTKEEMRAVREKGEFEKRDQLIKNLLSSAVDVAGEKVQKYFSSIDKDESENMRQAVIKAGDFPSIKELTSALMSGSTKIGFANLFNSREFVELALRLIFDPRVSPGESAWGMNLVNYLKSKAFESDTLKDFVKVVAYKNALVEDGKSGAALKDALSKVTLLDISKKISDSDAYSVWSDFMNVGSTTRKLVGSLRASIKNVIESDLRSNPSFKKFWERRRVWDSAIKPDVETKVERILMGDDTIPRSVEIPTELKSKILKSVEVPGKPKGQATTTKVDLSELGELGKDTVEDLNGFVGNLVDHFSNQRLRQMWRKEF